MRQSVLVTGGVGFIGSFIARNLIENDICEKVVLLDNFGRYVSSTSETFVDYRKERLVGIQHRVVQERGEGSVFPVILDILERHQPEIIIHLAALPLAKLDNISTIEALDGSVNSTTTILEIAGYLKRRRGYRIDRFVYASSSMVYGDFVTDPATEAHPTAPKEIYGTMKLAGEDVTRGLCRYFDIPFSIVRPSAVYGPTDMNRRVSQIFVEKAFRGEPLKIQGADEALDFTYVKDVANGFVLAATHDGAIGETFNITHGRAHTLLDFARCLQRHFPNLEYYVTERDSFRPKRGTLSIEKAQRLIGYAPAYDLQRGVDEYVAFVRQHNPVLGQSHGMRATA